MWRNREAGFAPRSQRTSSQKPVRFVNNQQEHTLIRLIIAMSPVPGSPGVRTRGLSGYVPSRSARQVPVQLDLPGRAADPKQAATNTRKTSLRVFLHQTPNSRLNALGKCCVHGRRTYLNHPCWPEIVSTDRTSPPPSITADDSAPDRRTATADLPRWLP